MNDPGAPIDCGDNDDDDILELDAEVGFCYVEGPSKCTCKDDKQEVAENVWNCGQPPRRIGATKFSPLITARRVQIVRAQLEGATPEEKSKPEAPPLKKEVSLVDLNTKKSAIKIVTGTNFDLQKALASK